MSTFEVVNSIDLTIGSSLLPLSDIPELIPAIMRASNPIRSEVIVGRAITVEFLIVLGNRLDKNGFIKVLLPVGEIVTNEQIPQFRLFQNGAYGSP